MISRRKQQARKGVAVTEAAVLLPFVVIIAFAAIELSNGFYLRQSLTLGAYEAAMEMAKPQKKADAAEIPCRDVLKARGITHYKIDITPQSTGDLKPGQLITVTVSAPADAYAMGSSMFLKNRTIVANVTVVRMP